MKLRDCSTKFCTNLNSITGSSIGTNSQVHRNGFTSGFKGSGYKDYWMLDCLFGWFADLTGCSGYWLLVGFSRIWLVFLRTLVFLLGSWSGFFGYWRLTNQSNWRIQTYSIIIQNASAVLPDFFNSWITSSFVKLRTSHFVKLLFAGNVVAWKSVTQPST